LLNGVFRSKCAGWIPYKTGESFDCWINHSEYVTDKPAFLKLHLIPPNAAIWTEDKFEDFIEARANLILAKLEEHTA
jgi:hypothetical protein